MENILKATRLAVQYHAGQTRKNNGTPYVLHPIRVAELVDAHAPRRMSGTFYWEDIVCAAMLHDTLEDTSLTYEQIVGEFGLWVADVVKELTQDKSVPWADRRRLMIEKCGSMSPAAKLIKLADRLDNMREMETMPDSFIDRYCAEARPMIAAMAGICPAIEAQILEIADRLRPIG